MRGKNLREIFARMSNFNSKFKICSAINDRLFIKIPRRRFFFSIMRSLSIILVLFKKAFLLVRAIFSVFACHFHISQPIFKNLFLRWISLVAKLAQQVSSSTLCPGEKSKLAWPSLQHNHVCCSSF